MPFLGFLPAGRGALLAVLASALLWSSPRSAVAAEPDGALAVVVGAATNLATVLVGSTMLANSHDNNSTNNAAWLTICGGFTISPVVAHGAVGEWGRGFVFASAPAAMTAGTVALFQSDPGTINHGSLPEQRAMWGLFSGALLASAAGIVDATFAGRRARAVTIAPAIGSGRVGFEVGGLL